MDIRKCKICGANDIVDWNVTFTNVCDQILEHYLLDHREFVLPLLTDEETFGVDKGETL